MILDYIKKVREIASTISLHALINWIIPENQRNEDEKVNCWFHRSSFRFGTSSGVPLRLQTKSEDCSPQPKHFSIIQNSVQQSKVTSGESRVVRNDKVSLSSMLSVSPATFLAVFLSLFVASPLGADTIDATNKYAWSENAGWLNFKSTHSEVRVYNDHLEGYVWSEAVGWIRLGTYEGGGTHSYANDAATTYGVNNDGSGNLSGYGWSENAGWIDFDSSHSQVTINAVTGDFDGYAWSEAVGWIHFQNTAPAYKVTRAASDTTPDAFSFIDQGNVSRSTVITSAAISVAGINDFAAISITGGEYEIDGSGNWLSSASTVANNASIKVRHTSSASYSAQTSTTLTIGGVSDIFTSTTQSAPVVYVPPPPTPTLAPTPVPTPVTTNLGELSVVITVEGQTLSNIVLSEKSPDTLNGIEFPLGMISFEVTSAVGGSVDVTLSFNQPLPETFALYKIDNEGTATEMPQSLWTINADASLTISLTDGGPFDLDGEANGLIVGPLAIGVKTAVVSPGPSPTPTATPTPVVTPIVTIVPTPTPANVICTQSGGFWDSYFSQCVYPTPTPTPAALTSAAINTRNTQTAAEFDFYMAANGQAVGNNQVFSSAWQNLDIQVQIDFESNVQNQQVEIFIVAEHNGQLYMKTGDFWVLWEPLSFDTLQSDSTITANSSTTIAVVQDLNGLAGQFKVFSGYRDLNGVIIYNQEPLVFEVR